MKPGATTWFFASMTRLAVSGLSDTTAMRPPVMPMLRTASSLDAGSMTRPLATTRSYVVCPPASRGIPATEAIMAIEAAIETIRRIAFSVEIDRSRTVREQETMDRNAPDDQSARSTWRLAMSAFLRVDPFQSRAIDTPMLESGMTQNTARGRIGRMMMLLLGISAGGCRGAEGPAGPTGPA